MFCFQANVTDIMPLFSIWFVPNINFGADKILLSLFLARTKFGEFFQFAKLSTRQIFPRQIFPE